MSSKLFKYLFHLSNNAVGMRVYPSTRKSNHIRAIFRVYIFF